MPLNHEFVSAFSDGGDATKLRPSNWNDDHVFTGGTAGFVLTRDTGAADGFIWVTPSGLSGIVPATRTVNGQALSSNIALAKADVGLGNVDNTSDAVKNAAVATLTNKTITSPLGLVKADVGLSLVENTALSTYTVPSSMVSFLQSGTGAVSRTVQTKLREDLNVKDFGAIGDGASHPLSGFFGSLGAAQVAYPHATSLTNEIDWAAIQAALNLADGSVVPTPKQVYLPAGQYLIDAKLTVHPVVRVYGDGRWSSIIVAASGFTGIMMQDDGNAVKIIIENLQIYADDEPGVTSILELGTSGVQWGTAGRAVGLMLRGGASVTNAGTIGLKHNSNVISVLDCHTVCCESGIVEAPGCNVTWYDDISVLSCTTYGVYVNGQGSIGRIEVEAPGASCVGVYCNRELSIDNLVYSQSPGATNSHAVEIGSAANSFSMSQFVHLLNGGSVLTDVLLDNRANFPLHWGQSATSGARRETGISDKLHVSTQHVFVQGQALQNFVLRITNTAGTLQHRFGSSGNKGASGDYLSKINAASATLGNTPTGADASTAMATGGKISSASTNAFICDTAAQDAVSVLLYGSVSFNNTGTTLMAEMSTASRDVNGVTRRRLELYVYNAITGANFALTTANIGAGTMIEFQFLGFLA